MTATDLRELEQWLDQQVVGQHHLIQRLLIALLADGHLLVEGAPGLAKTRAIKSLGDALEGSFHRIQFTPDLLPGDVTGTEIYRPQQGEFHFQQGPVFSNLVLADEVNRAPAKVQSALLEAMAERQVSIGSESYPLPRLFLVMATQNPIEQEGTYPLPEAQLDRFLLHVKVDYPDAAAERQILRLTRSEAAQGNPSPPPVLSQETGCSPPDRLCWVCTWQKPLRSTSYNSFSPAAIPAPTAASSPSGWSTGAARARPSRWIAARARMRGCAARNLSAPDDVQAVAPDVLRHRLLLSFEAEAAGVTTDQVIEELLSLVPAV